jgi:hypothetical protein
MAKKPKPKPCKIVVLLCALCVLCGVVLIGCDQTSAQRIAQVKAVVDRANVLNQSVDAGIAELDGVVQASQALLLDPNVPENMRPALQQALATASAKLVDLRLQKAKINAALVQWQAILNQTAAEGNNVDLAREIQTYAAMTSSSSAYLPPPYNGYVYLGGTLTALLAGLIASIAKNIKKNGEIDNGKAILTDLVISVGKLLDPKTNDGVIPPEKIEDAKFVLQDNQSGLTQDTVDAIKDPMQNTAPLNKA